MLKIFGQHRFYVGDGATANAQEGIICIQLDVTMRYQRRYIEDVGYKQQETDQDPCGTPNETDWRSDVDPFTTTLCVLSVK